MSTTSVKRSCTHQIQLITLFICKAEYDHKLVSVETVKRINTKYQRCCFGSLAPMVR